MIVEPDALASGCTSTPLLEYAVTRLSKLECNRGGGGPPAGQWFPEQAADLIRNANPPLA